MQFTALINLQFAQQHGLNLQQATLFAFIYELPSWADTTTIDGNVFYRACKTKIITELPILTDKPDTVYRLAKQLAGKGLIEMVRVNNQNYLRVTDTGKTWNKTGPELNPMVGKKSEPGSEKNPTYHITSNQTDTPPIVPPRENPAPQAVASPQPQSRKPERGTRLPDDWTLPDDWRAWAEDQRPELDADTEADKFRDYWIAKTGQGATKRNWLATWRNWIRNARGQNHETNRRDRKLSAAERIGEQAERVKAEMRRNNGSAASSGNGNLAEDGGDLRPPLDGEFWRSDDGEFKPAQRNGKDLGGWHPGVNAGSVAPWIPPNRR